MVSLDEFLQAALAVAQEDDNIDWDSVPDYVDDEDDDVINHDL
jgi:hypothetical protein